VEWDRSQSVMITPYNIHSVIRGFKKIIDNVYNGNIFVVTKNNKIISYKEEVDKNIVLINLIGGTGGYIQLVPGVVLDEDGLEYEGVIVYLNKSDNFTTLPIDYIESLYYILSKVDIELYGQTLMNYVISYYGEIPKKINKIEKKPTLDFSIPGGVCTSNFNKEEKNILELTFK
jgi:hypothetical protein